MGRPPCCDKSNVKKGPWTPDEDAKILAYVASHGIGNWTLVPQKAGLNRCGKSCRLRWTNYLRPDLKHDTFTPQEEDHILKLHKAVGSRWSLIAKQLPGRTDNDVKNHWNTKLRKKLSKMGIDPVTHKPISQILSEFGNISGLPNTRNQIPPFPNFPNTMPMLKTEPSRLPTELIPSTQTWEMINTPMMHSQTWENMAHFPPINQETIQTHFFNAATTSSLSSSSSSCQPSQLQTTPSSPSSWSDFLIGDPFISTNVEQQQQECEFPGIFSGNKHSVSLRNEAPRNCSEATSSEVDSFVDAILNRDSEMKLEFPEILDGFFDY